MYYARSTILRRLIKNNEYDKKRFRTGLNVERTSD